MNYLEFARAFMKAPIHFLAFLLLSIGRGKKGNRGASLGLFLTFVSNSSILEKEKRNER